MRSDSIHAAAKKLYAHLNPEPGRIGVVVRRQSDGTECLVVQYKELLKRRPDSFLGFEVRYEKHPVVQPLDRAGP